MRTLIHRYNDEGPEGLRDRRRDHPGAAPMLDEEAQRERAEALESGTTPDGGLWNGPKVARWIEEPLEFEYLPAYGPELQPAEPTTPLMD